MTYELETLATLLSATLDRAHYANLCIGGETHGGLEGDRAALVIIDNDFSHTLAGEYRRIMGLHPCRTAALRRYAWDVTKRATP